MKRNPKITVAVPAKNEEENIAACLKAVFAQTLKPYEVIVVNSKSTDRTEEIARTFPVKIAYDNYGSIGNARQAALEAAKGEYIAYTDADCMPEKNWLKNLSKELRKGVAGVGGGTRNIGEGIWPESIALALDSFLGSANSVQDRVFADRRVVKSLSGCNCMYRTADLKKIGGFDTTISLNEDTKISQKMTEQGKLVYVPDAIVLHNQNLTLGSFIKRMYRFGYGRAKNRMWDLQCVPPVAALLLLLSLIITPYILYTLALYAIVLIAFNLKIFLKAGKLIYLISVPAVYIMQHTSYTLGFWKGLVSFGGK